MSRQFHRALTNNAQATIALEASNYEAMIDSVPNHYACRSDFENAWTATAAKRRHKPKDVLALGRIRTTYTGLLNLIDTPLNLFTRSLVAARTLIDAQASPFLFDLNDGRVFITKQVGLLVDQPLHFPNCKRKLLRPR